MGVEIKAGDGPTKMTIDGKEVETSLLWFLPKNVRLIIEVLGLFSLLAWLVQIILWLI